MVKLSTRGWHVAERGDDALVEFARLLGEAHRDLFEFIFAMVQNFADAEDVYQQTALVLWKKFSDFTPGTNFVGWSIRVAQFEIKDYVKSHRRRKVLFDDDILDGIAVAYQAEPRDLRAERMEALSKCLEKLGERDRRLLKRWYSEDGDYKKIAAAEHKTITAIYQAIGRIRKALYHCIQRALAAESHS
jgi:RNA polymerase sigma-70 factor, ECF subfamily